MPCGLKGTVLRFLMQVLKNKRKKNDQDMMYHRVRMTSRSVAASLLGNLQLEEPGSHINV